LPANSNVEQHSWLGYYVGSPHWGRRALKDDETAAAQHSVELRLSRQITGGLHEDADITNFTQSRISISLELELESDFADPQEAGGRRLQKGLLKADWRVEPNGTAGLTFDYRGQHRYAHEGNKGVASLHRGLRLYLDAGRGRPEYRKGRIRIPVELDPRGTVHICLKWFRRSRGRR
jgi:hypothetical protein